MANGERHHSISIVMPAYNEEEGLEQAVLTMITAIEDLGVNGEIIIVNDCSQDKTGQIGEVICASKSKVRIIHHTENEGLGGAFRTGVNASKNDFVILIPIDNPLDAEGLSQFIKRMGVCDIIVGVRAKRVGYTLITKILSFIYNRILIPLLFNIGFSDVNWIQAYRRRYFEDKILIITYSGIFFLVEVLVRAKQARLVISEVPSSMQLRLYGKPTNAKIGLIWETFKDMVNFFYVINRGK
jgi:glycosyltransferase involved in cell wall biosynthesis